MTIKDPGELRQRVTFQCRAETADGFGNEITGDWADQFTVWARLQPKIGGEAVTASRLTGVQPYVLTVWRSSDTRKVTTAWRVYDAHAGTVTIDGASRPKRIFNIRSGADVGENGACIDFLVAEGEPG